MAMKITILAVGRVKEKFFRDAIEEYGKRLSRYCRFEILEVADEKTPEQAGEALQEQIKRKEAERILGKISDDAYVITLEITGAELDSVAFSEKIETLSVSGKSQLVFVIGGSLGLHESVSRRADWKISFSHMTFPHQLMRVILCEQIYRGFRIMKGEPYHK